VRAYFNSDNYATVLPEVMDALTAVNRGHEPAYGADAVTARVQGLLKAEFGERAHGFLVLNGTGANVVGLRALLQPWQGVVCAESAHLNVDEGGAPERVGGIKLLAVPAPDGKLTPELVESRIERIGDEHAIQPGVVSVTQSTELGTLYTASELRALADHAHAHGMRLHVDGARLANAAAALGVELREITTDAGADVVSFGGTKAGLMLGEAIVLLGDGLEPALPYLRKQSMQLASKMRYVAAQFEALLTDELWRQAAGRANAMAARLAAALTVTAMG
jgi:threonine aldolase